MIVLCGYSFDINGGIHTGEQGILNLPFMLTHPGHYKKPEECVRVRRDDRLKEREGLDTADFSGSRFGPQEVFGDGQPREIKFLR